jgi:hypothetical protein
MRGWTTDGRFVFDACVAESKHCFAGAAGALQITDLGSTSQLCLMRCVAESKHCFAGAAGALQITDLGSTSQLCVADLLVSSQIGDAPGELCKISACET